jgi:hypothetical protein
LPYNSTELFRWVVSYEREELQVLLRQKIGPDFGELIDLLPGERGASGRLIYLDIIGSKQKIRIGKELAIRRRYPPAISTVPAFNRTRFFG